MTLADANTGYKQTLADFEEMEELSETMGPGRKALWNVTKGMNLLEQLKELQQMGSQCYVQC